MSSRFRKQLQLFVVPISLQDFLMVLKLLKPQKATKMQERQAVVVSQQLVRAQDQRGRKLKMLKMKIHQVRLKQEALERLSLECMTQLIVGTVSFPWQLGEVNCKIFCFVSITLRKKTPLKKISLQGIIHLVHTQNIPKN